MQTVPDRPSRACWKSAKVVTLVKNSPWPRSPTWGARFARQKPGPARFDRGKPSLRYIRARYYDCRVGIFIQRDPLEYVDGQSLYRGYFVPGHMDPNGLEWEIVRKGKDFAKAIPTTPEKDTLAQLAKKVRLNESEIEKWLKYKGTLPSLHEPVRTACSDFEVPNHIAFYTSKLRIWDISLAVRQLRCIGWGMVNLNKRQGFKVTKYENFGDRIIFQNMWKLNGIYKVFAAGHGTEDGFIYQPGDAVNAMDVHPPYKLEHVAILSCWSGIKFEDDHGPIKNPRRERYWASHVSRDGYFIGHDNYFFVGDQIQRWRHPGGWGYEAGTFGAGDFDGGSGGGW